MINRWIPKIERKHCNKCRRKLRSDLNFIPDRRTKTGISKTCSACKTGQAQFNFK